MTQATRVGRALSTKAAYAHRALAASAFVTLLTLTRPAIACPSCETGQAARAQAWAEGFGFNLFVSIAPFVIVGAVSLWANGIGSAPAGRAARAGDREVEGLGRRVGRRRSSAVDGDRRRSAAVNSGRRRLTAIDGD
ncbi:MAG TPA: hypothetical protein VFS00_13420 [Polyangiaceae bacterium]|nr:hypothetical protein [Polyangiaceae bacterium]